MSAQFLDMVCPDLRGRFRYLGVPLMREVLTVMIIFAIVFGFAWVIGII